MCEEVLPFIKIGPSRSGNLVPGRPMRGHHPPQETQDVHIYSSCIYFIFIGHSSIHIENVRSASFLVNVPGKRSRRPSVCRSVQVPLTNWGLNRDPQRMRKTRKQQRSLMSC